jgi:hypothetical protein
VLQRDIEITDREDRRFGLVQLRETIPKRPEEEIRPFAWRLVTASRASASGRPSPYSASAASVGPLAHGRRASCRNDSSDARAKTIFSADDRFSHTYAAVVPTSGFWPQ